MKQILKRLLSLKWLMIPFLLIGILLLIQQVMNYFNIVYWPIHDYIPILQAILLVIFYLLGVAIWLSIATYLPTIILLIPLTFFTTGIVMFSLGWKESSPLMFLVLLMLLPGLSFMHRYRHYWVGVSLIYLIIGCIFFGLLEVGMIVLLVFGLAISGWQLYKKKDNLKMIVAGSTVIIPSLMTLLFIGLFLGSNIPLPFSNRGTILSPWGLPIIYEQKISDDFIDQNLSIIIYRPLSNGFYQIIGSYHSEFYGTITLDSSNFSWQLEEETYYLYIAGIESPIIISFNH